MEGIDTATWLLGGGVLMLLSVGGGWLLNRAFARKYADELIQAAEHEVEALKAKGRVDAEREATQVRRRAERAARERADEVERTELELSSQRDDIADQLSQLEARGREVEERERRLQSRDEEQTRLRSRLLAAIGAENEKLERISGLSQEDAKRMLLDNLRSETRFKAASLIREIHDEAQRTAERKAQSVIALAVERIASDFSATRTASSVSLPHDKIKGKLIGHEGKNIRAFERTTGIQLVIENGSDQVQLSGFHPIKREIARHTLESLLRDGTINPRRIEQAAEAAQQAVDQEMHEAAREALEALGIEDVHPEMVRLLGRLRHRTSYGQNVLDHSREVGYLTGIMATELGLDEQLGRRAGLFHDIGKAIDYEREGTHPEIGAQVAERYDEPEIVINAIASHHEDVDAISPISSLVAAADALSGARPGARRKSLGDYVRRIEKLESLANSMDGVDDSYAIQAGRELRVIVHGSRVDDDRAVLLSDDLVDRIQSEFDYPGKIKVTVIREVRASTYAR